MSIGHLYVPTYKFAKRPNTLLSAAGALFKNVTEDLREWTERRNPFRPTHFYCNFCAYIYICTGRVIIYSRITKLYYKKTVGHVFTKPVQIEGITKSTPQ